MRVGGHWKLSDGTKKIFPHTPLWWWGERPKDQNFDPEGGKNINSALI